MRPRPPKKPLQTEMFPGGDDLPLFSGSLMKANLQVFKPMARPGVQATMFDLRPEMKGAKKAEDEASSSKSE